MSAAPDRAPADGGPPDATPPGLPTGATMRLAAFAAGLDCGALPPDYRARLHTYLLDNVAAMLAGSVQPVRAAVAEAMRFAVGDGDCEAIGGDRVPLSTAVLLDGVSAGGFEFEHVMLNTHPASAVFPALLALAARTGASGGELMAAMAAGYEIAVRVGDACTAAVERERGFHNPGVNGTVAAAAGCARLLRLDAAGCASAMGLAASSSAGLLAFVATGAMTKRLHPARSAQLGLEAALLARAGVEGPRTALEDRAGLLHAFSPKPDPGHLLRDLGARWDSAGMIIKLAPVHALAQHFVHALNTARDGGSVWDPSDATAVVIRAGAAARAPGHMERAPRTLVAAQYSVPFSIAVAIARDLRNPLMLDEAATGDPQVRRIARLMRFEAVGGEAEGLGGTLHMTVAGEPITIAADDYPGFPASPGYAACVSEKFDRTLSALGIEAYGPALRAAVAETAEGRNGTATLRARVVTASRAVVIAAPAMS